ncbi:phosphatase activator [Mucor ambiguus]|uniref:Phosphatase activator n=1 Tax=Mucor ambiguus TaxID=91626 RepID=A0A0C9MI38_9FUNG|nr:phosphatase activator [Mucor ambiguus]
MATIITQVKRLKQHQQRVHVPETLYLNVRGTRLEVDKNTLRSIPETVLRVLFPQGLVEDANEYTSDFDPIMLAHLLAFLQAEKTRFQTRHSQFNEDAYLAHAVVSGIPLNPLLTKQGVVVLLEELVYFVICCENSPSSSSSSIKQTSLKALLDQDSIFDRSSSYNNTTGQQDTSHWVDVLHLAGFGWDDKWQVRSQQPNMSCIHSLAMASIDYNDRLRIGQRMMAYHSNPTVIPDAGGTELLYLLAMTAMKHANYGVVGVGPLSLC